MIPNNLKQDVIEYLRPSEEVFRKLSMEVQKIAPNLDNLEYMNFLSEQALKYLESECKTWGLCTSEFSLLLAIPQIKRIGFMELPQAHELKKSLVNRINQLGFPTNGPDITHLYYCLSLVNIQLYLKDKQTVKSKEEILTELTME